MRMRESFEESEATGDEEWDERHNPTQTRTTRRKLPPRTPVGRSRPRRQATDGLDFTVNTHDMETELGGSSLSRFPHATEEPEVREEQGATRAVLTSMENDSNGWTKLLTEDAGMIDDVAAGKAVPWCTFGMVASLQRFYLKSNESRKREQAESELTALRADLQSCRNSIVELRSSGGRLEQQNSEQKRSARLDKKEMAGVQKKLQTFESSLASLQKAKEDLQTDFNGCQDSLVNIKQELKNTQDSLTTDRADSENSKQSMQTELRRSQDFLLKVKKELKQTQDSLANDRTEFEKSERSMRAELQRSQDSLLEVEKQLADSKQSLAGIQTELDTSKQSTAKIQESKQTGDSLHNASLQRKDDAIQKLQEQLNEASCERDELKQAQSTREQSDARAREMAGNRGPPSPSAGQSEADTRSSGNNAGSGIPTDRTESPRRDQAPPASQPDAGQCKRKSDAALPDGDGRQVRQRTDRSAVSSEGGIVLDVNSFMAGTLQLPIPPSVTKKLRWQIAKWQANVTPWNEEKRTRNGPACIESRVRKRRHVWPHGIEKACDFCRDGRHLCVTWLDKDQLCLLPVEGGAEDQQDETHWFQRD